MKKVVLLLSLLACIGQDLLAQLPLNKARRASWTVRAYRIPADTAQQYLLKGFRTIDRFINESPVAVFPHDSVDYESLPVGNYLLVQVKDNEVAAEYYCRTKVESYVINNESYPQLYVRNQSGNAITNAAVFVNGKTIDYSDKTHTYQVRKRKLDDAIIKIVTPGDTSFVEFKADDKLYRGPGKQRWRRFAGSPVGRVVMWLPNRVRHFIKNPPRYWFRKRYKRSGDKGYMLFSKPKYFPSDTIKFKAYLVNKKGKPYRDDMEVTLQYYHKGRDMGKTLAILKPQTPGAYVYEFNTGDTLPVDVNYSIRFSIPKKYKLLLSSGFRIEDYLLDEVSTYQLKSAQQNYLVHDTLRFIASAKDANGLPLMDGRVALYLITNTISNFQSTRLFVPDTIWSEQKNLAIDGDTKFSLPGSLLPAADMRIMVRAVFLNSNNEIQEKTEYIQFAPGQNLIDVTQKNDHLTIRYYENGKAIPHKGMMETDINGEKIPVNLPLELKIDPHVDYYDFSVFNEMTNKWVLKGYDVTDYTVPFNRRQNKDTAGFVLYNPYRIPVYYTVFDKNKEIQKSSGTGEMISWSAKLPPGKLYTVSWQYFWAGQEKKHTQTVGVLDQLMTAEIGGASSVYPGQKDTITIKVKDYKDREAAGVNLTAVSYNAQFAKDIHVPQPPYIDKFRGKSPIRFNSMMTEEITRIRTYPLGKHHRWSQPFGLDTMAYYQFLLPRKGTHLVRSRVTTLVPQLAVHLVKQGVPQDIYLLYVNRQLAYFNGTTAVMPDAHSVAPGYVQIGIRTKDKYIQVDSIYMQAYYKHDIVFDLDSLPANAKVESKPTHWQREERYMLERQIMQLDYYEHHNDAYIWQGDRVVFLPGNRYHFAGPFIPNDSVQFFRPGDFDLKVNYEPGYSYRVNSKMARLVSAPLFYKKGKMKLRPPQSVRWQLGDTLVPAPVIKYEKIVLPMLTVTGDNYPRHNWQSKIQLKLPADSVFAYSILHQGDTAAEYRVLWGTTPVLHGISPGTYSIVLMTKHFKYIEANDIVIDKTGTYCIDLSKAKFSSQNDFIPLLMAKQEDVRKKREEAAAQVTERSYSGPQLGLPGGTAVIRGVVSDANTGERIPHASVTIKGYRGGTSAIDGSFSFKDIRGGKYIIVVNSVGYTTTEVAVETFEGKTVTTMISLSAAVSRLESVVVTGYGTARVNSVPRMIMGSDFSFMSSLSGRVPGVQVVVDDELYVLADTVREIRVRGIGSVSKSTKPLYIIDGVVMNEMPAIDAADIASTDILNSQTAIALYGSEAANGAIIITTKGFAPKSLREEFRDYAFWQPNLITDKNGEAKFAVTYPDNVTSWQTWVVGMDKKRRITQASKMVKSFKPMLAQLAGPQFLIAGDSVTFIGKKINYTSSPADMAVSFSVNGKEIYSENETVAANNSSINELSLQAGVDSIKAKFSIQSGGFGDGELRQIPVFRRGTMETLGQFYCLQKDTAVSFRADPLAAGITLYAQNNTLDLLLEEIDHLKKYPYYCMEQIASKITGFAMEKKIREALNQPFKNEKELQQLVSRLQRGQLFEGGWSWWQGGDANPIVTNYVTRALLPLREDGLLETNIRNALLYLHNNLADQSRNNQLQSLYTLSLAGHEMDYYMYLHKMPFDSLSQHQQWQVVSILQRQKLEYKAQLENLMNRKVNTVLGGSHWGEDNWYWERNTIATTVIAFDVLSREEAYKNETLRIIQYFLERRSGGYWRNTVESATILSTILPQVLNDNKNFAQPATIDISGDTSFVINRFPFSTRLHADKQQLSIKKTGGGIVYFTAYQQLFNSNPQPVDSLYRVSTHFETERGVISTLKAGEKVKLKVRVEALKEAEYVQVEVPIPAGCTYGTKITRGEYREYYKDRVLLFVEKMKKGVHEYEIWLEPRYTGRYSINPAKVELMYFPTFYGRDGMKGVRIGK